MKKHSAFPNRKYNDGINIDKKGYVLVAVPKDYDGIAYRGETSKRKRYVYQHRLMMEKKLGRCLKSSEIVHHKNGVKYDNREENLELILKKSEHHIKRVICPKCGFEFRISGKLIGVSE